MKITIFTSNQPRHLSLIEKLSTISNELYAVIEANTIFPGKIADFFKKSEVMQQYFNKVMDAEKKVFGDVKFIPKNCNALKPGLHTTSLPVCSELNTAAIRPWM